MHSHSVHYKMGQNADNSSFIIHTCPVVLLSRRVKSTSLAGGGISCFTRIPDKTLPAPKTSHRNIFINDELCSGHDSGISTSAGKGRKNVISK